MDPFAFVYTIPSLSPKFLHFLSDRNIQLHSYVFISMHITGLCSTHNCLFSLVRAQLSDLCEECAKKLILVIHPLFLFAANTDK